MIGPQRPEGTRRRLADVCNVESGIDLFIQVREPILNLCSLLAVGKTWGEMAATYDVISSPHLNRFGAGFVVIVEIVTVCLGIAQQQDDGGVREVARVDC